YRSFGWDMPLFAHMPLTLKPSGQGKLSKRDGDKLGFPVFPLRWINPSTDEISPGYREEGYFPESFVNIIALLGWNPGTEQEIFTSMDELVEAFSLDRIGKSGARFDPSKAKWINHQHLVKKDNKELAEYFMPYLQEKGIEKDLNYTTKVISLVKERMNFINDAWDQGYFFFEAPENYDEKVVKKRWKNDVPIIMNELKNFLESLDDFSSSNLEEKIKNWIEEKQYGLGQIMNGWRLALVGTSMGPHLFDIAELLGKEEVIRRMNRALEKLK
ncbi:MAG: glutamate--tRNA ligase, partial [Bacteroidota bacterium]